jgi:hypothetical protein
LGGLVDAVKRYGMDPAGRAQAAAQSAHDAAKNGDWKAAAQHMGDVLKESFLSSTPGVSLVSDIAKGSYQQGAQALQQAKAGQYGPAAVSAAGAVPFVGPLVAKPASQFMQGDVAGGLGTVGGELATFALPKVLPRSLTVLPEAAKTLDPAEAAAVKFGEGAGVPMTAATRSGSPVVRNIQKVAMNVPGAGTAGREAVLAEQKGLSDVGEQLAQKTGPAATAESAGAGVRSSLEQRVQNLRSSSQAAYNDLATMEADPKNIRTIQTGTKTTTSPVLGPNGQPLTQAQPIIQQIGMPVDMRPVKASLQPIFDELKRDMPITRQQASVGLKAIENIVNGDDYMSASAADRNLSAVKAIQREGTARAAYLAGKAIDQFSPAVDQAVAQAGPQATAELQNARSLWKAKTATEDTLNGLPTEPVQLFNKLTSKQDVGVNLLRDIESKAPSAMPAVTRAYLDGMMQRAFAEAGQAKPGTVLNEWQKLGPSTKSILVKDPVLRGNLDNFFVLAKKAAENPNPSGTATTGLLTTDGAFLVASPHLAVPYVIGRAALGRVLLSQGGARALANGLRVPVSNPAAATLAANQILKIAGPDAVPATQ